jgi:hypothetical protein
MRNAILVTRDGKKIYECPACHRKLAEVTENGIEVLCKCKDVIGMGYNLYNRKTKNPIVDKHYDILCRCETNYSEDFPDNNNCKSSEDTVAQVKHNEQAWLNLYAEIIAGDPIMQKIIRENPNMDKPGIIKQYKHMKEEEEKDWLYERRKAEYKAKEKERQMQEKAKEKRGRKPKVK